MKKHYKNNWLIYLSRFRAGLKPAFVLLAFLISGGYASAQLSGSYTIDSSMATGGTNFQSFTDFADTLHMYGVSDAVEVEVVASSGPYYEQVTFMEVAGASSVNTITINGNGEMLGSGDGYVILLDGADHFTFDNLVIDAMGNGSSGDGCIAFMNGADSNMISNCELIVSAYDGTGSGSSYVAFTSSLAGTGSGSHGSDNVISGNKMWSGGSADHGPYYGILDYRTSGDAASRLVLDANEISNVFSTFIYLYYSTDVEITDNNIHSNRSDASAVYGYYNDYGYQMTFTGNKVHDLEGSTNYGGYMAYCSGTSSNPSIYSGNEFYNFDGSTNYVNQASYSDYLMAENNLSHDHTASSNNYYAGFAFDYCDNSSASNNEVYNMEAGTYNYYTFRMYYSDNSAMTDNDIHDLESSNYNYYFFYIYYSNDATIEGNRIHHNNATNYNYFPFYIYYCTNATIVENRYDHNTASYNYYAFYTYQCSNSNISYNEIDNNSGSYYGVYMSFYLYYATNSIINGNSIHDNEGQYMYYGWYFYYATGSTLTNNIYYNNSAQDYVYYPLYMGYSDNVNVSHNTIVLNNSVAQGNYYSWYIYYYNTPVNVKFKNNILYISGAANNQLPIYCYYNANLIDFENNVVYVPASGTKQYYANSAVYSTFDAWKQVADDQTSLEVNPQFVSLTNGNLRPQNPALANIGTPGMAALDYNKDTRTACGPDPGAFEFFVDHDASDLVFDVNPVECGNFSTEVGVTFNNGTSIAMKDVKMYYDINGETRVDEMIPNVGAGASEDYTFNRVPVFNTPGTNTLTAGLGCDDDESNNTMSATFDIVPAPSGAQLTKGTVFNGYFEAGTQGSPDVTVSDYVIEYVLTSPSKYSDADYGSDWTITSNMMTSGGDPVGASDGFVITNPSGSTPGKIRIDPDVSLEGSEIYVSLLINDLNTGCDSVIGRWMYIPYTPTPDFTISTVCLGDNMILKNTSMMGGVDPIISTWDYNDPGSSDDPAESSDGFWKYSTYGDFDVTLKTVNYYYPIFEYTITKTVTVKPTPEIDYKVVSACEGEDVVFDNHTTLPVPGTIGYKWDFGDGTTSTLESPTHLYSNVTPDGYVVTLTATTTADGCPSTLSKKAYQFSRPVADFSSEGSCNLEDIQFMNATTLAIGRTGYSWDFGDGSVSTLKDPVHVYSTPGTKSVTMRTYSEFGCDDEKTIEITLLESPEADFSHNETCNLTPVEFTRTGSIPSGTNSAFSWDFNGQSSSTDENPSYLFSEIGKKSVTLEITSLNGCSSSITKELDIALQPAADFEVADVCEGDEAVFTNKSKVAAGNLTYEWKFGDNETSVDVSPTHEYDVTGTTRVVNVTLTAYVAGGCEAEISKPLTLIAAPDADFSYEREGRTVRMDAPSGMNIYQWRFGDGGRSSIEDPVYTYENVDKGEFMVCLTVKNDQCWNEECEMVPINLLGIEDLDENKLNLQVYPNPGSGIFNLSVNSVNQVSNLSISVSDILGNVIPVSISDKLNGNYVLDLSEVATGVYFVQVQDGQYKATKRITVSR